MKSRTNQSGFSIIEIAVVVVLVGIVALLGYTFYNRQNSNPVADTATATQSAVATDVPVAPAVKSTGDLDAALAILDQTNPAGSNNADATLLDSQVANF